MARREHPPLTATSAHLETLVVNPGMPCAADKEAVLACQQEATGVLVFTGQAIHSLTGCLYGLSKLHHIPMIGHILQIQIQRSDLYNSGDFTLQVFQMSITSTLLDQNYQAAVYMDATYTHAYLALRTTYTGPLNKAKALQSTHAP